ncbi:NAD(P)H-dependent oxidoreductase [uncultured Roseibium sp.]|uniref:NAD(P)H-dependent oxidoreductase n=1 Tax=uncultured Roseibium sp. TaxID=1936171 RepID=UPI002634D4EE|nr:NAD(P)H-dependent oxidoreductase [uncultured Roseibium sp.]
MTITLIVLVHPAPTSFNAAWAEATETACLSLGDEVLRSDLYAMGFDPAERPGHYASACVSDPYDVLKTQEAAARAGRLPADVQHEIDKVRAADRIILHFPVWWFAPPAMLKGWCERVLVNGGLHDTDNRFDTGRFRGKSVLFCATTGSRQEESAYNGKEGDIQMLLWPLAYTFRYLGFDVLRPRTIHGVHGYHKGPAKMDLEARLQAELAGHCEAIAGYDTLPRLTFNADSDFERGRLRPGAPVHSHFIRHEP